VGTEPTSLPRDHVRRPDLPWRTARLTECGKPIVDVASCITREEMRAKVKQQGVQRAAFTTCMTCMSTGKSWPEWDEDPVRTLGRDFYAGHPDPRMVDELRALAALVDAHRDEFDGYMAGIKETVSLAEQRKRRRAGGTR
jgi:hypothetical protein